MTPKETSYPCPECQMGNLHPRRASYFTTEVGSVICVPDFPAWVCDVCGRREYDPSALAELRAMLDTDRNSRRRRRPHPPTSTPDTARPPLDPSGQSGAR